MDAMFDRWDPVGNLDTERAQIQHIVACLCADPGDGSLIAQGMLDVARSPLAGSVSWSVRAFCETFVHAR